MIVSSTIPELTELVMQIRIFDDAPQTKEYFVKSHGMLAVVEVLQVARASDIIGMLLRIVNLVGVYAFMIPRTTLM